MAVANAHYAMYHALAHSNADVLIGPSENRGELAGVEPGLRRLGRRLRIRADAGRLLPSARGDEAVLRRLSRRPSPEGASRGGSGDHVHGQSRPSRPDFHALHPLRLPARNLRPSTALLLANTGHQIQRIHAPGQERQRQHHAHSLPFTARCRTSHPVLNGPLIRKHQSPNQPRPCLSANAD